MSYEATLFDLQGNAVGDIRAIFDRAWLLNGYEQCTFDISALAELSKLDYFQFGRYLGIVDSALPIWGGFFDPTQSWSTNSKVTLQAYSGEKLFDWRAYPGELQLSGSAGAIFRQIVQKLNTVLPWPTLMALGSIYEGGVTRQETISAKKFYDDVIRISERSGNDFWCEPVIQNGVLRFDAHWFAQRGAVKDFALEEGINIEAKENVMEYQGEIWNFIFAYGNVSTWAERETAVAYDQASIDLYGPRMYPLAVDSNDHATVQAYADAFLYGNKNPKRSFNLAVTPNSLREDEVEKVYKTLRIGDTVDLKGYSFGKDNGSLGVNTRVQVRGMTHRGKTNSLDLIAKEVML